LKNIFKINSTVALFILLITGCAQPGVPSGGPVDKSPPEVVKSIPTNESVNFSGSSVQVTFDEYVQLNDINNQLIISPPLTQKPEITLKKKTLKIEFTEALLENTTYSVNFGEGVKDYNAGNILRNYIMAFSTGPELDSLAISGKITDAFTSEGKENVKVMLYNSLEDSLPRTVKPYYFSQTDTEGNYNIKYLPEGAYKLFALEELDGDFLYNNLDENIGFLDTSLLLSPLDTIAPVVNVSLFNEELDYGYISSVKTDSTGVFKIAFSAPQRDVMAFHRTETDSINIVSRLNGGKDTLFCYTKLSKPIYVHRKDKRFLRAEVLIDTLEITSYDVAEVYVLNKATKITSEIRRQVLPNQKLIFESSLPIQALDSSKVKFVYSDSLDVLSYQLSVLDEFHFMVSTKLMPKKAYRLDFFPGVVNSAFQLIESDSTVFKWNVLEEKDLGEIKIKLTLTSSNQLVQLTNGKGEILHTVTPKAGETISFSNLKPASLSMRLIEDENQDKYWTTGNYDLMRQPEKVLKFPQKLEVRANWSQEFIWED